MSPQERSAAPIPRIFDVTIHETKLITLVQGSSYFRCHKWLLPSLMSLLFHINSSSSNEPILFSKSVYSVQNMSWVTAIYSSDSPENNILITLLTYFLLSLSEISFASLQMCGIIHSIHPVTVKLVLMCNCLFYHIVYTDKLSLSNVSESILSGS